MKILNFLMINISILTIACTDQQNQKLIRSQKHQRKLPEFDINKPFEILNKFERFQYAKNIVPLFINERIEPSKLVFFKQPDTDDQIEMPEEIDQTLETPLKTEPLPNIIDFKYFKSYKDHDKDEEINDTQKIAIAQDIEQKVEELTKMKVMELEHLQNEIDMKNQYIKQQREIMYSQKKNILQSHSNMILIQFIFLIFVFI